MVSDVEEEVHRAITAAWIGSDPVDVVLRREERVPDGASGYKTVETELVPQTFRIDRSTNASLQFIVTEAGTSVPERFRLVGAPDADVASGDDFVLEGRRFTVRHVHLLSYQRVAAEVEYRGQ